MDKLKARRTFRLRNEAGRGTCDDVDAQSKAFEEIYPEFAASLTEKTEEEK